ncbi:hypothetical protein D3C80_310430 [compost metagenome]
MSRARNIKPAFFANEELGECSPLARLLFIGLWTEADYKGDLEWRPKRLKAQLLPYDLCDVEALTAELVSAGVVRRYTTGGRECLAVCNFIKHQNPHKNEREKGSDIPAWDGGTQAVDSQALTINRDKSGVIESNSEENGIAPADSLFLNPDSRSLIPEPLYQEKGSLPSGDGAGDQQISLLEMDSDKGHGAGQKKDVIPCQAIIDLFNEKRGNLPKVMKMTTIRQNAIKRRWADKELELNTLEAWAAFFDKVNASAFLQGWKGCGLDWLLEPKNMIKVMEGNYSTATSAPAKKLPTQTNYANTEYQSGEL